MEYQSLDDTTYAQRFRELIAGTESLHRRAQEVRARELVALARHHPEEALGRDGADDHG